MILNSFHFFSEIQINKASKAFDAAKNFFGKYCFCINSLINKLFPNNPQYKEIRNKRKKRSRTLINDKKYKVTEYKKMKSSLKFCVVAAGEFDLYIAEPRAYEWDIAAGHAILEHAGGTLKDFDGNEIEYGKADFKNSSLILKGKNIL